MFDRWTPSLLGILALAALTGCGGPSPAEAQYQDAGETVAMVGGVAITLDDVDRVWRQTDASSQIRLLQQLYDTRRQALELVIGEHLVAREAEARGVSRDELLAEALPPLTRPVTDEEIRIIYERNRDRFGGRSLEELSPEIRAALEQQRPQQALTSYMAELRGAATDVSVSLDPPRQEIEVLAEDPAKGPEDAPVVIVEFSDFQCPFCERATGTLNELVANYGDQIRFVYKDFPLPNHAEAFKAAEAGNCANDQGRFWELHDRMFATQSALGVDSLKQYAVELGMDGDEFAACLDEGRHADKVQRDLAIGQQYGVSSTPTIFINGRVVMGAMPYQAFDAIVSEEIAAAR